MKFYIENNKQITTTREKEVAKSKSNRKVPAEVSR